MNQLLPVRAEQSAFYGAFIDVVNRTPRLFKLILSLLLVLTLSSNALGQVDSNVVGYWSMNESSGTTVGDQSSNGLTGSFVGPLSFVSSSAYTGAGNALNFPGNGYVSIPHNAIMNTMQNSMTIEAWVFQTDNVNNAIVDRGNYNFLFMSNPNGQPGLGFYNPNGGWSYSTSSTPVNQWFHAAMTWDGNTRELKFYLDGVLVDTFIRPSGLFFNNSELNIGRQQPDGCRCNLMNGLLDDVRLSNVVRTQSEIQASVSGHTFQIYDDDLGQGYTARYLIGDDERSPSIANVLTTGIPGGKGEYNLSFWIKPKGTSSGFTSIFHNGNADAERSPGIWFYPGTTQVHIRAAKSSNSNAGADITSNLALNQWHHISVSVQNSFTQVYLNGNLINTDTSIGTVIERSGNFYFSNPWFKAANADVRNAIWTNKALSPAEVTNVMNTNQVVLTDDTPPTVVTNSNVTVSLDSNGNGTLTAAQIDNGSSDASGIASLSINKTSFDCDDVLGNSLNFDGDNDNVRLTSPISIGSGNTTVEAWVKVPEIGQGGLNGNERVGIILGNFSSTNNINYEIHAQGQLRFFWNNGQVQFFGKKDLRDGKWHHVAFVRISSENRFIAYIDGELEFNEVEASSDVSFSSTHRIGGDNRSDPPNFHGNIDELRIWNVARSQADIQSTMLQALNGSEANLLNYWNFEEGSGTTITDLASGNTGNLLLMDPASDWETGAPNKEKVPVTLTVTDNAGNSASETVLVTVQDAIAPTITPSTIDLDLEASGSASVSEADVQSMISDNCEIVCIELSRTTFNCNDLGLSSFELTVVDASNNSTTATIPVQVNDVTAPGQAATSNGLQAAPQLAQDNVPEAGQYGIVYELDIPNGAVDFRNGNIPYTINNSGVAGTNHQRIAYFMQLDNEWVWVSFDDFLAGDLTRLGIPSPNNEVDFQRKVTNMNVFSNKSGIVTGEGIGTGNIEMWDNCYGRTAVQNIGGSSSLYDFDDQASIGSPACYGSFQVHNHGTGQTIFAFNSFMNTNAADLGIGNSPTGEPDWTFRYNSSSYSVKKLYILVDGSSPGGLQTNDITVQLDANGQATITPDQIDAGNTDGCGGPVTLSLDRTTFTCDDLASNNSALSFNGSSSAFASIPYSSSLSLNSFTIEAWVRTTRSTSFDRVLSKAVGGGQNYSLAIHNGKAHIRFDRVGGGQNFAESSFNVNDGQWHHLAGVHDTNANTIKIYVDGVLAATRNTNGDPMTGTQSLEIGRFSSAFNQNFLGDIDDVRVWNDVRTDQEITDNYNKNLSGNESGLVAFLNMNEGSGAVAGNSGPSADATLSSGVSWVSGASELDNTGQVRVTLTVTDAANNAATTTAMVTVEDNIAPTVNLNGDATIDLNQGETYTETAVAEDNCSAALEVVGTVDTSTIGTYVLTYKATDASGNESDEVVRTINVIDITPPIVTTQDIAVQLDANGNATISPEQINNGSTDTSGGQLTLNLDQTTFDCGDLFGNDHAYEFNGTNNYVPLTRTALGLSGHTIQAWVKTTSTASGSNYAGNPSLTILGDHTNDVGMTLGLDAGKVEYNHYNGNWESIVGTVLVNDGDWHHISLSHEQNGTVSIYVDGVLDATGAITLSSNPTYTSFDVIGASYLNGTGYGDLFDGALDDIRIWNTALDVSVIGTSYELGLSGSEANLVANYQFNEASGTTLNDSANGLNGLITGGEESGWVAGPLDGVTIVTLSVTDPSGNTSTATASVIVEDNIIPTVNLNGDAVINLNQNEVYTETATAEDNCAATLDIQGSVDTTTAGTYILTYKAADGAGNESAETIRTINVIDVTPPSIVCAEDVSVSTDQGVATAQVQVTAPQCEECGYTQSTEDIEWPLQPYGSGAGGGLAFATTQDYTFSGPFPTATEDAVLTINLSGDINNTSNEYVDLRTESGTILDSRINSADGNINRTYNISVADFNAWAADGTITFTLIGPPQGISNVNGGSGSMRLDLASEITLVNDFNGTADASGVYPLGSTTVTWTATDAAGNQSNCTQVVTVVDTEQPALSVQDITVSTDDNSCTAIVSVFGATATDNSGFVEVNFDQAEGTTFNLGSTLVTATATDAAGNASETTFNVIVEDNIAPTIIVNGDAIVYHNAFTPYTDAGATADDNCSATLDTDNPVNVNELGTYTVTYTATDGSGNVTTATRTVIVQDVTAPTVVAQDITVQLDANGNATITPGQVDNGSSDDSGQVTLSLDQTTFDCDDLNGTTNVAGTALAFDGSLQYVDGNTLPAVSNSFTMEMWVNPQSTHQIDGQSTGGASGTSGQRYAMWPTHGQGWGSGDAGMGLSVGTNGVSVYEHAGGYMPAMLVWQGSISGWTHISVVYTNKQPTLYINGVLVATGLTSLRSRVHPSFGRGGVFPGQAGGVGGGTYGSFNGEIDDVRIWERSLSAAEVADQFNRPLTGNENGLYAYMDFNEGVGSTAGNAGSGPDGQLTNLDTNSDWINSEAGISASSRNQVTLTVTDPSGNTASATANVTVQDNIIPQITAPSDISLNATSASGAVVAYTTPMGTDNCSVTTALTAGLADGATFPIGTTLVTYRATDGSGNTASASFNVTVTGLPPQIVVPANITVSNDAGECGAIVDFAATETTAIPASTITYDIQPGTFFPVGSTTVTATATSPVGTSSASFTVTVEDNEAPVVIAQDLVIDLDENGNANISAEQINDGSADNCEIASISISQTDFDCSNVGDNTVTLTVTDIHGNTASQTANVTINDVIAPEIDAQGLTVSLDANGNFSLDANNLLETPQSARERSIEIRRAELEERRARQATQAANFIVERTQSELATLNDQLGSATTEEERNTIQGQIDNKELDLVSAQDRLALEAAELEESQNALAALLSVMTFGSTSDACGVETITASQLDFDCSHVGPNTVTLTVTDVNNNVSTSTVVVTVVDDAPAVVVTQDITVDLDANGSATIVADDIDNGSYDACGIANRVLDITSFDCGDTGANVVTLTVTDVNGNVSSNTATVTVRDIIAPTVITKDITVALDENGAYTITAADINDGSFDNCDFSLSIDNNTFNCSTLGANTVNLTATDASGNETTMPATVTVIDNAAPTIVAENITVELDEDGLASITVSDVDGGTYDNCGVASVTINMDSFGCDDLGENIVTLTATDVNGNVSSGPAVVNIIDVIAPTVGVQNISVDLNENGVASILPEDVLILSEDDIETGEDCTVSAAESHAVWLSNYLPSDGTGEISGINSSAAPESQLSKNWSNYYKKKKGPKKKGDDDDDDDDDGDDDDDDNGKIKPKNTRFVFDQSGGSIHRDLDGTATVTGRIVSTQDANDQWIVTLNLANGRNWDEWSALGRSYKDEKRLAGNRFRDWTYYEIAEGSQLTGAGRNAGEVISLSHAPTDYRYGFQLGEAANSKNANFGMSGWFFYTNRAGKKVQGDFNLDITDCQSTPPSSEAVITGDNCGIASTTLSISEFSCNNLGENIVQVTVTDQSGNATTKSVSVTVNDRIAPVAIAQNITVSVGASGRVEVDPATFGAMSTDNSNCGLTYTLDKQVFDCGDVGKGSYYYAGDAEYKGSKWGWGYVFRKRSRRRGHKVTLTVTDVAGNSSSTTAYISVVDDVAPVISEDPITVVVYGRRSAYLSKRDVAAAVTDNCKVRGIYFPRKRYSRKDAGLHSVWVKAFDYSGNMTRGTVSVNVVDISSYGRYVDICYEGKTRRVRREQVQNYLRRGASLGSCQYLGRAGSSAPTAEVITDEPAFSPELKLSSYPNPTSGYTVVSFSSQIDGLAKVSVLNTNGIQLKSLFDDELVAKEEVEVGFEAADLPSGIYLIRMVTAGEVKTIKLVVRK